MELISKHTYNLETIFQIKKVRKMSTTKEPKVIGTGDITKVLNWGKMQAPALP